jgi:uncharacterized protein (TIGR03066 family)
MKMVKIFSLLLLLVAFGCKDDEKEEEEISIVGKWKGDNSAFKVTYGIVPVYDQTDDTFDVILEFTSDGKVTFTQSGITTEGTYSLTGDQLTTNVDFQAAIDLSNATFDVQELSKTKLRLHMEDDREINVPDIGPVVADIIADFSFDRL